jgi:hypothetical protein
MPGISPELAALAISRPSSRASDYPFHQLGILAVTLFCPPDL